MFCQHRAVGQHEAQFEDGSRSGGVNLAEIVIVGHVLGHAFAPRQAAGDGVVLADALDQPPVFVTHGDTRRWAGDQVTTDDLAEIAAGV